MRGEKSSLCQLSAGGAKRDVEETSKCTHWNCIRTPQTNLDLPPRGRHRAQLSQKVERGTTKNGQQGLPRCVGLSLLPLFCSIRGPALPLPTPTTTVIPGPPSASDATLANFLSQKSSISASIPTSYIPSPLARLSALVAHQDKMKCWSLAQTVGTILTKVIVSPNDQPNQSSNLTGFRASINLNLDSQIDPSKSFFYKVGSWEVLAKSKNAFSKSFTNNKPRPPDLLKSPLELCH